MIEVLKQARKALEESLYATTDKSQFLAFEAITSLRQAIAELESQEPVAWMDKDGDVLSASIVDGKGLRNIPLYTHPPQRIWVGLTDGEIKEFDTWYDNREEEVGWCNPSEIVAYIEAKLKEKNNGRPPSKHQD